MIWWYLYWVSVGLAFISFIYLMNEDYKAGLITEIRVSDLLTIILMLIICVCPIMNLLLIGFTITQFNNLLDIVLWKRKGTN